MANVQCIVIGGSDARTFAQAQFSEDVAALAPGHWQWNAWLTPQGRVQALMHLADPGDGRLLAVLRGGDAQAIRASLARYLLRSRATLAVENHAAFAGGPVASGTADIDAGEVVLGYGTRSLRLGTAGETPFSEAAHAEWRLADIRAGWPSLPAGAPELLPPALGMEHLGAVSLEKGCYPGQEIVARLHYRGGHKYRLYHLQGTAPRPNDAAAFQEGACRVLDEVSQDGTREVLAVGPWDMPNEVSLAGWRYRVVTRFDP